MAHWWVCMEHASLDGDAQGIQRVQRLMATAHCTVLRTHMLWRVPYYDRRA